jgi:hypothetical protein
VKGPELCRNVRTICEKSKLVEINDREEAMFINNIVKDKGTVMYKSLDLA